MKKHRVVAAIDFGTHATGFAWAVVDARNNDARRREIYFHTQWPAQPIAQAKNLTALLLDANGDVIEWGYAARRRWSGSGAASLQQGTQYISSFKMKLAKDDALPVPSSAMGGGIDARQLISHYLKRIYDLAIKKIVGSGYVEEDIRWCLTVPAIWTDYQKQLMREAAVTAGFPGDDDRLIFALEPEAAAHYARLAGVRTVGMSGKRANLMSPGSRFMIADCGGGTVDITAYRTDNNNSGLIEIGNDCGGGFGSEFVNRSFVENILQSRLGSFDTLELISSQNPAAILEVVDSWEREKVHVTADQVEDIYLPLPAAIDRLLSEEIRSRLAEMQHGIADAIVVTAAEAREAFETVIPNILQLIDKQLEDMRAQRRGAAGREIILLVGGFGSSPYLQSRVEAHVKGRADVLVPGDPRIAVLSGAVHFAYDPQTRARRAKFTYGCDTARAFREGIDPESRLIRNARWPSPLQRPIRYFCGGGGDRSG